MLSDEENNSRNFFLDGFFFKGQLVCFLKLKYPNLTLKTKQIKFDHTKKKITFSDQKIVISAQYLADDLDFNRFKLLADDILNTTNHINSCLMLSSAGAVGSSLVLRAFDTTLIDWPVEELSALLKVMLDSAAQFSAYQPYLDHKTNKQLSPTPIPVVNCIFALDALLFLGGHVFMQQSFSLEDFAVSQFDDWFKPHLNKYGLHGDFACFFLNASNLLMLHVSNGCVQNSKLYTIKPTTAAMLHLMPCCDAYERFYLTLLNDLCLIKEKYLEINKLSRWEQLDHSYLNPIADLAKQFNLIRKNGIYQKTTLFQCNQGQYASFKDFEDLYLAAIGNEQATERVDKNINSIASIDYLTPSIDQFIELTAIYVRIKYLYQFIIDTYLSEKGISRQYLLKVNLPAHQVENLLYDGILNHFNLHDRQIYETIKIGFDDVVDSFCDAIPPELIDTLTNYAVTQELQLIAVSLDLKSAVFYPIHPDNNFNLFEWVAFLDLSKEKHKWETTWLHSFDLDEYQFNFLRKLEKPLNRVFETPEQKQVLISLCATDHTLEYYLNLCSKASIGDYLNRIVASYERYTLNNSPVNSEYFFCCPIGITNYKDSSFILALAITRSEPSLKEKILIPFNLITPVFENFKGLLPYDSSVIRGISFNTENVFTNLHSAKIEDVII